jgi:hypothetical protein
MDDRSRPATSRRRSSSTVGIYAYLPRPDPPLTPQYSIGPKIRAEDAAASAPGPAAKKTSGVDVYRGCESHVSHRVVSRDLTTTPATYQFGYYLQKAEHHSLLIKVGDHSDV